jgi:metal-responsive CopG/Arc/MetJ family transcriptional regulator
MRHKLPDDKKKSKFSITIDKVLDEILTDELDEKNVSRSKYIEKLIREDIKNKGFNVDPNF